LAKENYVPLRVVNQLVERLCQVHVLTEIRFVDDTEHIRRYQPAMDINQLTVGEVLKHVEQGGTELFLRKTSEEMEPFWDKWMELKEKDYDFNGLLVKDLLNN
jgi:hypothetical protein